VSATGEPILAESVPAREAAPASACTGSARTITLNARLLEIPNGRRIVWIKEIQKIGSRKKGRIGRQYARPRPADPLRLSSWAVRRDGLDAAAGPWSPPLVRTSAALLASLLALAGCATFGRGFGAAPPCPESVERCATGSDCVYDAQRGCSLCTCRAWDDTNPRSGAAANAVPEESRPPPPPRAP
jgi:hypothetical protein